MKESVLFFCVPTDFCYQSFDKKYYFPIHITKIKWNNEKKKHDIYYFVIWIWKMKYCFQLFIIKQYKMFYDFIMCIV